MHFQTSASSKTSKNKFVCLSLKLSRSLVRLSETRLVFSVSLTFPLPRPRGLFFLSLRFLSRANSLSSLCVAVSVRLKAHMYRKPSSVVQNPHRAERNTIRTIC